MATVHPAGTDSGSCDRGRPMEPLAVSPRQACLLLGIGNTRLYELIRDRELVTYHEGRARRITMASIHARVARLISGRYDADKSPAGRFIEAAPCSLHRWSPRAAAFRFTRESSELSASSGAALAHREAWDLGNDET
jgi:excisionase family DNA binding protein